MNPLPQWKDLAQLGRISNLPTCMSGAIAGFYLGGGNLLSDWFLLLASCFTIVCFYEAGMVFNDFFDREVDAIERPERPIPSGRISPFHAQMMGGALLAIGLLTVRAFFPHGLVIALVLVMMILIYDRWHLHWTISPLIMGTCRGLIYPLSACAAGWTPAISSWTRLPLEMALYVSFLSWLARDEMIPTLPRAKQTLPFLASSVWFLDGQSLAQGDSLIQCALLLGVLWSVYLGVRLFKFEIRVREAVGGMLAAIALWDAAILATCSTRLGVGVAWICFLLTILGHRKIRGT